MSVWGSRGFVMWSLRHCNRRFPWKQRCFSVTSSTTSFPNQRLSQVQGTETVQTLSTGRFVSFARFYSQDRIPYIEPPNEKEHLSPPVAEASRQNAIHSTAPGQTQKIPSFYEHLEHCNSPSDVLDLTCRHAPTVRQVSNSLTRMWTTTKKMSDDQRRYELRLMFEHPAFEKLLQRAMKNAVRMRTEDLAFSLLGMVNLGVPQRSRVIQTYLRSCQEKLNDFDERSLSILASSLVQLQNDPNVDALKHGMRLIVEARLPRIKNVKALQTVMRLVGKNAPLELKRKLERKALSMAEQFSLPNAQYMISTMATMGFFSKPLLDICSAKIIENLDEIPFNRLYPMLQSCRELLYRDMGLFTAISDYVASSIDIWTHKQLVLFLPAFENLGFCPTALMEAFAEKVIANPDALTLQDIICVLKVYSSLNYDLGHQRQQFLDGISLALESYVPKMSGFDLLKTVYFLCLLGHFPSVPLEKLLQNSSVETFSATAPQYAQNQARMFETVHLCLQIDRPILPQPLSVPKSLLRNPISSIPVANRRLSQALQGTLTDKPGVQLQEMDVVEEFYLIDAVITKSVPNQALGGGASGSVGDSSLPAESSERIAVLCPPQSYFCYGTSCPCGLLATKIRHLKVLGYSPVLVTSQQLETLPEEKAVDLLIRLIFPEHQRSDIENELN